jgi:peptidyl-prolyl cis-trans isomerase C
MSVQNNSHNKSFRLIASVAAIAVLAMGAMGYYFTSQSNASEPAIEGQLADVAPAAGDKSKKAKAKEEKSEEASAEQAAEGTVIAEGDPVVAKINGKEIKRSQVFQMIVQLPPQLQQLPIEQLFPMALDNVINAEIVMEKSLAAKLENDEQVKALLAEAEKQIIRNVYLEREVSSKINDKVIKARYDEVVGKAPEFEEIKARHILLETEDAAKEAIKKLDAGADFATLTKEVWPGAAEQNNGELGYFVKEEMVPEFSEAAFKLGVNKYSKEPVKSQFGYHVIKVEDKRKRQKPTLEQVKPQVEQEVQQTIATDLLAKWQKEAKVQKFDINGK